MDPVNCGNHMAATCSDCEGGRNGCSTEGDCKWVPSEIKGGKGMCVNSGR